jgi:tetratricopeptide (TPR) repeat protein
MPSSTELKEQGLAAHRGERFSEAAAKFAEAVQAFEVAGDRSAAAEMRNNLCVVKMAEEDWEAAIAAVEGTPAVFHALGDTTREAQALANLAAAHDGAGHNDEALELYQRAIDQFGELGEKDTRAACFKKLSGLQLKRGQQMQALASMRSGLNLSSELSPKEKALKGVLNQALKMIGRG